MYYIYQKKEEIIKLNSINGILSCDFIKKNVLFLKFKKKIKFFNAQ